MSLMGFYIGKMKKEMTSITGFFSYNVIQIREKKKSENKKAEPNE